ncbi:MAG TPA: type IV pilus twitching motility protein PilT [Anaeromyxobacter sp.]|nr:type IV pilus twitching motility protein PilT [Anaeromyxobacter sp.]
MPRIDAFIDRLFAETAQELRLESGSGAVLATARGPVPLLRQPLTAAQIVGAFAEVVPADLRPGFPRPGVTAFPYLAPAGQVEMRIDVSEGGVRAMVSPRSRGGAAEPAPRAEPPADPTAAAPSRPAAAPATPARPRIPAPQDPRAALDALLEAMLARRASDLHLSSDCAPILRVDGDMTPEKEYGPVSHERLKELLWSIAPERNREEWHARKDTDFAHETAAARFRVNVFADRKGIGAVLRQIPNEILTAEQMGLSPAVLDLCRLHKGLVLVTGPTGSGKSTTLAAMIDYINRNRDDHIVTIEDPIEFVHPNKRCLVNQREVGIHTSSFKQALRAALREDPDIVLVGELRDLDTIAIAIETAETGHLVFGTLHTNTAPSTVDRIIDQFPADRQAQIRMMLSESLKGVIAQTLCKKIGGGRVAALEILLCSSSVSNLIREGKTFQIPSIMQTGRGQGMATLNDALLDLAKRKVVEPREALLKAVARGELRGLLERAGFQVDPAA